MMPTLCDIADYLIQWHLQSTITCQPTNLPRKNERNPLADLGWQTCPRSLPSTDAERPFLNLNAGLERPSRPRKYRGQRHWSGDRAQCVIPRCAHEISAVYHPSVGRLFLTRGGCIGMDIEYE